MALVNSFYLCLLTNPRASLGHLVKANASQSWSESCSKNEMPQLPQLPQLVPKAWRGWMFSCCLMFSCFCFLNVVLMFFGYLLFFDVFVSILCIVPPPMRSKEARLPLAWKSFLLTCARSQVKSFQRPRDFGSQGWETPLDGVCRDHLYRYQHIHGIMYTIILAVHTN